MRKTLALVTVLCCAILCASTFARSRDVGRPHRFVPEARDTGLVQVHNPADGKTWSAWSYRNGAEFDVAVSFAEPGGLWSEPLLVGLDDGSDQIDPSLAVDPQGTVYLAYVDRASDVIEIIVLRAGSGSWSVPTVVTQPTAHGRSPSLRIVGDRLIVAYRSGQAVHIMDFSLVSPAPSPSRGNAINDGPDPTGVVDDNHGDLTGGNLPIRPPRSDDDDEEN